MLLDSIINAGESATVEFKSSFNQEAIEAVGAFANKNGGVIVVGLKSIVHCARRIPVGTLCSTIPVQWMISP